MNPMAGTAACVLAACTMAACGTPPQALDQANNGVRLTASLHNELSRYQRNASQSAQRRLASIQAMETGAAELARDQGYDAYLANAAGKFAELQARVRIREASDAYTKLVMEEEQSRQELAARLASIVKDLPSPAEKLGAVQKALAELGTELSMSERIAIVTKFLGDAKAIVDKNTQAADGAASAPGS
jgi:hypothetical protein